MYMCIYADIAIYVVCNIKDILKGVNKGVACNVGIAWYSTRECTSIKV